MDNEDTVSYELTITGKDTASLSRLVDELERAAEAAGFDPVVLKMRHFNPGEVPNIDENGRLVQH